MNDAPTWTEVALTALNVAQTVLLTWLTVREGSRSAHRRRGALDDVG